MVMKIVLQPATTNLDNNTLYQLAENISKEYRTVNVTVASPITPDNAQFQLAFDKQRNQWDSFKLLGWLQKKFRHNKGTKILALFDVDAYSSAFDFVFGEAYYQGRIAAVYLPRLRQEFYGLKPNYSLFYERLVKESIHELGHVFGIIHCKNRQCVMHFSISLHYVDTKESNFCDACRLKYFR
jgi:archaemetzincin